MPKQRTHSGTKRRFRITRTGKVMGAQKNRKHLLERKSASRKRRLDGATEFTGADAARVKRLLRG